MLYGTPEQNNNTPQPQDGSIWNNYVMPSINVALQAFQMWLTSYYGSAVTQQVVSNPDSQMAMYYWMLYQQALQNQQQKQTSNNDVLKYVAIGAVAIAVLFMATQPSKK